MSNRRPHSDKYNQSRSFTHLFTLSINNAESD